MIYHHHTHTGTRPPPAEDAYSFDQMVNDLGKEFSSWSEQRRAKAGRGGSSSGSSGSSTRERSLWEELADLGEELVDALEEVCGGCVVGV